jgi:8-oxo-dGTP diphosphatase
VSARARPARHLQADGRLHGVVVGVRRGDGRWLMVRRSSQVSMPGKVCFPGGGIEEGETQEEACVREAHEELGAEVRPLQQVWRYEFADRPITLHGWLAEIATEGPLSPDPVEVTEVLWLTPGEGSSHIDGLPTNRGFIEALEEVVAAK